MLVIVVVGIVWGMLPHMNKRGVQLDGITSYTAKRYLTAAVVLLVCAAAHQLYYTPENETGVTSTPIAVASGILSAITFLAYVWCLSENDPSVVTSSVYVLGLASAVAIGSYLRDEELSVIHRVGIGFGMLACALLAS